MSAQRSCAAELWRVGQAAPTHHHPSPPRSVRLLLRALQPCHRRRLLPDTFCTVFGYGSRVERVEEAPVDSIFLVWNAYVADTRRIVAATTTTIVTAELLRVGCYPMSPSFPVLTIWLKLVALIKLVTLV